MPLIQESLAAGKTVQFMPRGVSMLPMVHPGVDSVTLSPAPKQLHRYDLPLYQRANGQYILHRVVKAEGSTYTCIGDNQFVTEPGVTHDQVIALVTAFTHKGKQVSVTSFGYQAYCRFWCWSRSLRYFVLRAKGWLKRHLFPGRS